MKNKVIVIAGPTAVGKTNLSIKLAKEINGEIISGDSMQVYRNMNIGTSKIKQHEMKNIPHYMIDIKDPSESFSVAQFKAHVQSYITKIINKNKIPIIVGGSGLYIQSVLYDYKFSDRKRDRQRTERLERQFIENGIEPLYERLKEIDPIQAKRIHPNNHRRVIRALEIYDTTGKTMTEHEKEQISNPIYDYYIIGLTMERHLLYDKINSRVDDMIAEGLVDEVRSLYMQNLEDTQAMKAIGYKEIIPYIKGEISLEEAINVLKRNTRRYAKRQLTWFRNKMKVNWYDVTKDSTKLMQQILYDINTFLTSE